MGIVVEDVFDFVDEPGSDMLNMLLSLALHQNVLDRRRRRSRDLQRVRDLERVLRFLVLAKSKLIQDRLVLLFDWR